MTPTLSMESPHECRPAVPSRYAHQLRNGWFEHRHVPGRYAAELVAGHIRGRGGYQALLEPAADGGFIVLARRVSARQDR